MSDRSLYTAGYCLGLCVFGMVLVFELAVILVSSVHSLPSSASLFVWCVASGCLQIVFVVFATTAIDKKCMEKGVGCHCGRPCCIITFLFFLFFFLARIACNIAGIVLLVNDSACTGPFLIAIICELVMGWIGAIASFLCLVNYEKDDD